MARSCGSSIVSLVALLVCAATAAAGCSAGSPVARERGGGEAGSEAGGAAGSASGGAGAAGRSAGQGGTAGGGDAGRAGAPVDAGALLAGAGGRSDGGSAGVGAIDAAVDGAPGWTPAALGPALVLWLDGSRGVEHDASNPALVTAWNDQSSYAHKAVIGQEIVEHAWDDCISPELHVAAAAGRDAVGFAQRNYRNTCLRIPDSKAMHFGKGDFTVAVVFRHTTPVLGPNDFNSDGRGHGQLFGKEKGGFSGYGPRLLVNSEDGKHSPIVTRQQNETANDVVTPDEGYNDGGLRLLVWRRKQDAATSSQELRVNGRSKVTKTVAAQDFSDITTNAYLGNNWHGDEGLVGEIAELVVVTGTLADADLAQLEAQLMGKYALLAGER